MGLSLFMMSGILAYNGMLTGSIPKDKNLRRQKFDTGWRPYSFKLGEKYYSFDTNFVRNITSSKAALPTPTTVTSNNESISSKKS